LFFDTIKVKGFSQKMCIYKECCFNFGKNLIEERSNSMDFFKKSIFKVEIFPEMVNRPSSAFYKMRKNAIPFGNGNLKIEDGN